MTGAVVPPVELEIRRRVGQLARYGPNVPLMRGRGVGRRGEARTVQGRGEETEERREREKQHLSSEDDICKLYSVIFDRTWLNMHRREVNGKSLGSHYCNY